MTKKTIHYIALILALIFVQTAGAVTMVYGVATDMEISHCSEHMMESCHTMAEANDCNDVQDCENTHCAAVALLAPNEFDPFRLNPSPNFPQIQQSLLTQVYNLIRPPISA